MMDHPDQLFAVEFSESDQARLTAFSCGDEDWSRYAAEWIRGSDVLNSMKRGTEVWLFENTAGDIVGFGSVGKTRWRWPLPDGSYTPVLLIPMLGIDRRFRGQPRDPAWRFSLQIMSHLLHAARQMSSDMARSGTAIEWLVLTVHRDNARAIAFYERCGFEVIPNVLFRNDHRVMKLCIGEVE